MPSPILLVLAAFAAGVILLSACAGLPPRPLAVALAGIAALLLAYRAAIRRAPSPAMRVRVAIVGGAMTGAALAGFGYAAWRSEVRLADELPARWEGEDVEVVGVVDELPRAAIGGVRFAFAVERVRTPGAVVPSRVSIAWYAAPRTAGDDDEPASLAAPEVHAGERWSLTVRLVRPHGSVNPAGFDLEAWLFAHGLRANGYVRADGRNVRVDAFAGRPADHVERARERIRARIFAALPDAPYAGVLAALTIGDQRAIPEAQWAVFNRTGVAHLVSISGLHVTVFALIAGGAAFALLRRVRPLCARVAARRIAVAFGLAASAVYVALAGAEVPALRTLAMLAVSALGLWLARPGTGRSVWLWALVAVLVLDPWSPLAPGFWLSFGAVALLVYALGSRLHDRPRGAWAQVWHALREAGRTQWAVTIGLVPPTIALFGQVSLVSPLANAVAIPLVTFVVVPLALVATAVPFDAAWGAPHAALSLLMALLEPLATLPASAWTQHAPIPWTVAAGMAGVLLLLAPRGVPGRPLGAVFLVPLFVVAPPAPPHGAAHVTVLDVGQGLAVAVRTATHALVYDTGPRYSPGADAGGRIVAPFLRAAGMPRLSMLVVSHADTDHSGGALSMLATVPVGALASSLADDHPIVRAVGARAPVERCEAGRHWRWDGVDFTMLHPSVAAYDDEGRKTNDLSCVLRVDTAHGRVLIAGDVEARSEHELLGRDRAALAADVLVVPHHGSRTSSTAPFVAAVSPRVAIVTAGYRNRFGHPRADVLARYAARGIAVARTDRDGAAIVALERGRVDVTLAREALRRYWHARDPVP